VRAPDDHRRRANHALRDPALLVLVEPGSELVGEAELAVRVVGRKSVGQDTSPARSPNTSSAWPFPSRGALG
jgi:hypothetical protein